MADILCPGKVAMSNFADRKNLTMDNPDILRGVNSASVDLINPDPAVQFQPQLRGSGGQRRGRLKASGEFRYWRAV